MQLVDFESAKNILSDYNIPLAKVFLATSKKDVLAGAKKIGYPIFLKVYGKNILHRTDLGGVSQAGNAKEAEKIFSKMMKIKEAEGVLVQKKILGKELIIGVKQDEQFGPVILVGLGGIFAEAMNDIVLRIAPVTEKEALKMFSELKGYAYLRGIRDNKPVDLGKISKIISSLSEFSLKNTQIKEIDLNPVIASEKEAVVVDFKFLI